MKSAFPAREVTVRELPVARSMAGVNMRLDSGVVRELHWHPDAGEWQYYLVGEARMTVFDATAKVRTFNCRAGDVGLVHRNPGLRK